MAMLHFIEAEIMLNGHKVRYFCERDPDKMNRRETVADIEEGQFGRVCHVYAWDTETGRMEDVSDEIAEEILLDLWDRPSDELRDFLDDALGDDAVEIHMAEAAL